MSKVAQGCKEYFDGDDSDLGVCCIEDGRVVESVYGTGCKV